MQRLLTPIGQMILLVVVSAVIGLGSNALHTESIPLLAKKLETATEVEKAVSGPLLVAINLEQAKQLYDDAVIFIDARSEEYYDEGHIAGAWKGGFLLELAYNLEEQQGKDGPIVVYCSDDGCGDSEDLAYDLQAQGFTRIYVFKGGWQEWTQAGYPTE